VDIEHNPRLTSYLAWELYKCTQTQ